MTGKKNIGFGFLFLGFFLVHSFFVTYLFTETQSTDGKFFNKLAPALLGDLFGLLFSVINILIGSILSKTGANQTGRKVVSWLAIVGLFSPLNAIVHFHFGVPGLLIIIGAISLLLSIFWLAFRSFFSDDVQGE
ncbi:MAG: hypothetical protein ACK5SQ_08990 [Chitinophagales bacterium]|jgi:hypothetical protein